MRLQNPTLSHIFGPIYALSEGVALGIISLVYATAFGDSFGGPGIIGLAIIITMSIFGGMLFVYASRIIRVTSRFRKNGCGSWVWYFINILVYFHR